MEKNPDITIEIKTGNQAAPVQKFTGYQVFVIALMALIQFTIVLDFMILSPLGDIMMKALHLNTRQFGSVVSAYAFSAGISGFLAAGFADKYDRKKLLLFFYTGFVLGTVMCGLANNYEALLIARIITGVFGGVIGSISLAIVADLFTLQQRGRVMAFVQMAFSASQILGVPAGLLLATVWNWHITFFMVAGFALVIGLLALFRLQPVTGHLHLQTTSNPLKHLWSTVKKKHYRMGYIAIAVLSMGGFMLMPFTSAFLVNNVNIPQSQLPIIFLFTGLASIVIMPLVGKLSDKIDKYRIFTVGSIIACIMIVIYTNLSPVPIWVVILINMILFMGIMGRIVPATALNSAVPEPRDRGAYMSVFSSLQQLAGGLAAVFAGFVVYQENEHAPIQNFDILGYVMVGFILWCLYLVYRVSELVKTKAH